MGDNHWSAQSKNFLESGRAGWWTVRSGQRACNAFLGKGRRGGGPVSQFSNNGPSNRDPSWEILSGPDPVRPRPHGTSIGTSTAVSCGGCRYVLLVVSIFPALVRSVARNKLPNSQGIRISSRSESSFELRSSRPSSEPPPTPNTDRPELTTGTPRYRRTTAAALSAKHILRLDVTREVTCCVGIHTPYLEPCRRTGSRRAKVSCEGNK